MLLPVVIDQEVQIAALVGLQDMLGVKTLIATRWYRITRWGFGSPTSQLLFVDQQIEPAGDRIEHDLITVADQSDGTTHGRFRGDV